MKSLPKEHEKFHRSFEVFLYTFYNDFKAERFIARVDKLVTCQQTINKLWKQHSQQAERARRADPEQGI